MAFFEWDDSLSVGVPLVDADHQVLISLINQLHDTLEDPEAAATVGSVLSALEDYTGYHFTREERAMEAVDYPTLPEHHERHEKLKQQVAEIRARYARDPAAVDGQEVLDFLKDWLKNHILQEDMAYRPYMEGRPEAISAAEEVAFVDLDDLDELEMDGLNEVNNAL